MSDNTPLDGKKNPETDAAASPETAPAHDAADQTAQNAPESASSEHAQSPLVIDYDAINANLSAAERSDAATASADARNLSPMSTAEPVASADVAAPSLADDYADSYAPTNTMPARSTAIDPEPVVAAPVPLVVGSAAAAAVSAPPLSDAAVDDAALDRSATTPVDSAPAYAAPVAQSPIYVQAPIKPRDRSNRGGGILIALVATLVFAVLYAAAAFIIIGVTSTSVAATVTGFTTFAALPVFYVPILFFFLAYAGLIALVNRGGWWAYVLFGFVVGVVVYLSYIGGALLGLVFDGTSDSVAAADLSRFVASLWLNPGAIAAGLIAREVPIWAGAWIARRGRRVTARNLAARTEYERLLADGPQANRA